MCERPSKVSEARLYVGDGQNSEHCFDAEIICDEQNQDLK